MATETTAASPVPIELELQPSSQNAVEQENTLANQPQPASARTSTGPLRLIPRRRLQSGVWETASNVASFIPRGFKSLFRSFVNVLKSMNKMVLLGGLFIATAGCVPAYMGLSLQAWTARKDYLQECRDHFKEKSHILQGECTQELRVGLGPPPFKFLNTRSYNEEIKDKVDQHIARAIYLVARNELVTGSSSGELTSTFTGTDHSSDEQQDSSWFYDVWSYLITLNAILITPLLFFIILSAYFFMVSSLFLLVFAGIKYCWPASWKTKLQGLPTQFVLQGISLLVTVVSGSLLLYKFRSLFWQTGRGQGRTAEDEFIEYCKKYVQTGDPDWTACSEAIAVPGSSQSGTSGNILLKIAQIYTVLYFFALAYVVWSAMIPVAQALLGRAARYRYGRVRDIFGAVMVDRGVELNV